MSVKSYASYIAEQQKRNNLQSTLSEVNTPQSHAAKNSAGGSGKDAHYAGDYDTGEGMEHVDHAVEHAKKKGYKVNHKAGIHGHASTNIFDGEKHKDPHKKPDVTFHYAYGDDMPHAYTVHHNGAAAHDKRLHRQSIHTHNGNESFDD